MKVPARERILETANLLFTARGYGNVGINEIISRSSTAKATFYDHFPSKNKLCSAWLASRHFKSESEWETTLQGSGRGEVRILAVFDQLKEFLQAGNYRGCPYTNTTGFLGEEESAAREQIVAHKLAQRDFFIALAGSVTTPARARKLGAALFLLYSGATMESQNARKIWPVEAARETAKALLKTYSRPG